MDAVLTSEVIVHVIRKPPCEPNAGGSINQLRVARIKTNLLVILKIDVFDYYVANSSSISMVPNGILGLGVWSCSRYRWKNLPSGHQRNTLLGLKLRYMYWDQKYFSEKIETYQDHECPT